jgi:hypothetical protein
MIAAELAERRLVELKQNFAELFGFKIAGREGRKIKSFIKGESVQRIASSSNPKIVSTSPPRHQLLVQTASGAVSGLSVHFTAGSSQLMHCRSVRPEMVTTGTIRFPHFGQRV